MVAVYVDDARAAYGRMRMCHLLADSYDELMAMVDKIGVKRKWFQHPPKASAPHFDICLSKRNLAIKHGALVVSRRDLVPIIRRSRVWWLSMVSGGLNGNRSVQERR